MCFTFKEQIPLRRAVLTQPVSRGQAELVMSEDKVRKDANGFFLRFMGQLSLHTNYWGFILPIALRLAATGCRAGTAEMDRFWLLPLIIVF